MPEPIMLSFPRTMKSALSERYPQWCFHCTNFMHTYKP